MFKENLTLSLTFSLISCAVATVLVAKRLKNRQKWLRVVEILNDFEESCETSVSRLKHVVDAMAVEMHAGLASDGGSKLKMLLTFVDRLPTGMEKGFYYALDLGGTYFRVLRVKLVGERSMNIRHDVERQLIPQSLMTRTSEDLFDFIAGALKQFVDKEPDDFEQVPDRSRDIGFTFSFPVKQLSVSSGELVKWTKGYAIEDTIGKDVGRSLEDAMAKKGLDMQVAALVNDTVGTLALGHYHDEDTVAAVVFGTGTNACYVEQTDAIIKCQGHHTNSDRMVINMEWGNFWSAHLPRTSYDVALDEDSPNPYEQGFEKMISGMYLGEIARRVLQRMAQESDVFGDDVAACLATPFSLRTPMMATMHEDDSADLVEVSRVLKENLQMPEVSVNARKVVVRVCDIVTRRAARLAAAGIVGILKKIRRDGSGGIGTVPTKGKLQRTVVAIEGGMYMNYSFFREYLNEAVGEILGDEVSKMVILKVYEDGSGIGTALLAASHSHSSDR